MSLLKVAALVVVTVVLLASPASAHGGGSDATNFRVDVLEPGYPGLSWRTYGGDALIELTNRTGSELTLSGYEDEPYLQFRPGVGVFENTRSPAAYLNQDRYAGTIPPATADPSALPQWRQVASGDRYAWHDHRVHWMSPARPAMVDAAPDQQHVVLAWELPIALGDGTDATARGELRWVPGVAWWPPVLILSSLGVAVALVAAWRTRPDGVPWPGLARPVVVLLALVVGANALRTLDDIVTVRATFAQHASLAITAVITLGVVVALLVRSWRGHPLGFLGLAAAGVVLMLLFGGEASAELSASQIATSLPTWVRRWTVAASYAAVAAPFAAGIVYAIHHKRHLDRTQPLGSRPAAPPT